MSVAAPPACPLTQLFSRVQAGDETAFVELHTRTHSELRSAMSPILRSADLADDVLQDTYLQIWQQRDQFQPASGSVIGWMRTIARRRAIDRVRATVSAHERQTRYTTDPSRSPDTDHQDAVTNAVHATAVISGALDTLTRSQREALHLTYWDGRTAVEAAELLGIPVPTLKSWLRSATSRLRRLELRAA